MVDFESLFESACRVHTAHFVARYLLANSYGRLNGAEKADRHRDLCNFYVAVWLRIDRDRVGVYGFKQYEAVHDATQALTDNLDEAIGFPLDCRPDYDKLGPLFFAKFHELAISALAAEGGA